MCDVEMYNLSIKELTKRREKLKCSLDKQRFYCKLGSLCSQKKMKCQKDDIIYTTFTPGQYLLKKSM